MEKILFSGKDNVRREIFVCPYRELYRVGERGSFSFSAAVICTMDTLHPEQLNSLQIHQAGFRDVVRKDHPDIFRKAQAEAIAAFLEANNKACKLYFCCDSGESRSAAVCAAYLRYLGGDEMRIWRNPRFHPNPHVYALMCSALHCPTNRARIHFLRWINRIEFKNQIRRQR